MTDKPPDSFITDMWRAIANNPAPGGLPHTPFRRGGGEKPTPRP